MNCMEEESDCRQLFLIESKGKQIGLSELGQKVKNILNSRTNCLNDRQMSIFFVVGYL